jgi:hypothetical protein
MRQNPEFSAKAGSRELAPRRDGINPQLHGFDLFE